MASAPVAVAVAAAPATSMPPMPPLPPGFGDKVARSAVSIATNVDRTSQVPFHPDNAVKLMLGLDDLVLHGLEFMQASDRVRFAVQLASENKFKAYTKNPECQCPAHEIWDSKNAKNAFLFGPCTLGTLIKMIRERYKDHFVVDLDYIPNPNESIDAQNKIKKWITKGDLETFPLGYGILLGAGFNNSKLVFALKTSIYIDALRTVGALPKIEAAPSVEESDDGVVVNEKGE